MAITPEDVCAVVEKLTGSTVDVTAPVLSTGIIDSLGVSELADALTTTFGVDIDIDELTYDQADTPEQIAVLLNAK